MFITQKPPPSAMLITSFQLHSVLSTAYSQAARKFLAGPSEKWEKKGILCSSASLNCFSGGILKMEVKNCSSNEGCCASQVNNGDLPLPGAFLEFLEENGLDPSIYSLAESIPRYIRVKPEFESDIGGIESELNCKLEKVIWLPSFYSIPPHIQIASSQSYQLGKIYGMDAASGAAVLALNVLPGDHVLDLCAAPGAKLCMLCDMLGRTGSLTGVDVARHRLAACRTMLQKYSIGDVCRLFVSDGTSFSVLPFRSKYGTDGTNPEVSEVKFAEWTNRKSRKEKRRERRARERNYSKPNPEPELLFYGRNSGVAGLSKSELFRPIKDDEPCSSGYDKVLVDAECTHDGSIKHIQKFESWGWKTLQRRVLDAERTDDLFNLQLRLLTNGFKLLKTGGTLVYSTCSLTVAQNEDVIQRFLCLNPLAELQEVNVAEKWPCKAGRIPKTLRFDPSTSQTSGLFIAKISKLP
ncbi:S-adenosyl-L-methionine-dependent methyltransferases superfamily protein [Rhynchospora pubera]|uniref:S-adenosyl-L-methionine-dependent methyltransferases superfamily protein n=1 Tax=Rhynchospora pubera TaxID=906938 RepID=A0AAV8GQ76_9POAL|nr:S-adenosyl-L-methionine-dependent methyltransferases superfamily protein [Rhynchospora pubera]